MEISKSKIVVFSAEAPPSLAGSGVNAYLFSKFLSSISRKTTLCHLNYNNHLDAISNDNNFYIKRFTYFNKNLFLKLVSFPFLLFNYLKQVLQNDIIFVYSGYLIGFQFILILGGLLKKKVIFRSTLLNGDDFESLYNKTLLISWLNRYALKKITLYYAINSEFSSKCSEITKGNIPIFQSFQGVNYNQFHPVTTVQKKIVRNRKNIKENELIFLSVGNLIYRKGYQNIFPELAKLKIPFTYLIVGEYQETIFHRVSDIEVREMNEIFNMGKKILGDRVCFVGPIKDIPEYFFMADVFLHGSILEGTPNVILEAMACSLPVVVKKITAISGSLIKNNINAIEFEDYRDLPFLIEDLFKNPTKGKKLGIDATQTISNNYTFEIVAKKLFRKLNEI